MDLAGMLNDGDAPPKKTSLASPPSSSRGSVSYPSPSAPNGTYSTTPGAYAPSRPSQQQTPLYGPPPASVTHPSHSQSRGLTPLQTPSHTPREGQYPFPQQPQPPLQSPAAMHPSQQQHQQLYRGQEPYSAATPTTRPSSHGYALPSPSQAQYPSLLNSTSHHSSASPPAHQSQTPHSMRQSPLATLSHPPPQVPPQQYHQSQPNTPLGPPQLTTRHSNQQLDLGSPYHQRKFSSASNGMTSGSPAQRHPSIGNLVDSPSAHSRPSPQTGRTSIERNSVDRERSVSVSPKTIVQPRPSSLGSRHSSQQEILQSAQSSLPLIQNMAQSGPTGPDALSPSYDNKKKLIQQPALPPNVNSAGMKEALSPPLQSQTTSHHKQPQTMAAVQPPTPQSNKRRAEDDLLPTAKRLRRSRYTQRPVWANLAARNPKVKEPGLIPNSHLPNRRSPGARALHHNSAPPPPPTNGELTDLPPWQQKVPLDHDLIHARKILGIPWEKSIKWNVPNPMLNKAVADWLYDQLDKYAELDDRQQGTIEIEAKVGTLVDDNGFRCNLPVQNTCVLDPAAARKYRFESEMNEHEHKHMNHFLNTVVQESHANKGRQPISYQRIRETDSFRTLNKAGQSVLPPIAHKRRGDRQQNMRISTDTKTGAVTARIVKVKLGDDLHIFGASDPYDVRISMNLEFDLNKPGFDTSLMTEELTEGKSAPQPNRKKDRLSYKHLVYSFDLTRVDRENMAAKYELELEMDSKVLVGQYSALKQGQPNAYLNIVDGFIDNMMLLTKQNRQEH